jgi:ankyrin repeat protein
VTADASYLAARVAAEAVAGDTAAFARAARCWAARPFGAGCVLQLLHAQYGLDLAAVHPGTGLRATHLAAAADNLDLLLYLRDAGACVNAAAPGADGMMLTPLVHAMRQAGGHLTAAVWLLVMHLGADLAAPDLHGHSAMHHAASLGSSHCLSFFLAWAVAVPSSNIVAAAAAQNARGETPLHLAATADAVRLLARACPWMLERARHDGLTPLMAAAEAGDVQRAQWLLEQGASAVAVNAHTECPAVHHAASPAMVALLARHGARADAPCRRRGTTLLHRAAARNDVALVRTLLDAHGVAPYCFSHDGTTPLHAAAHAGHLEAAAALLERASPQARALMLATVSTDNAMFGARPLHAAVLAAAASVDEPGSVMAARRVDMVRLLLDHDRSGGAAAVNAPLQRLGLNAPLHLVAASSNACSLPLARALLLRGASPLQANAAGDTPLHLACVVGNADLAGLLARADGGGTVNAPNHRYETPIFVAIGSQSQACVRALLGSGHAVDLGARNGDHDTPLILATRLAAATIIAMLLEHAGGQAACINARGADGYTALARAAQYPNASFVRMLLRAGADPAILTARGASPLQLAASGRELLAMELLALAGPRGSSAGPAADGSNAHAPEPPAVGVHRDILHRYEDVIATLHPMVAPNRLWGDRCGVTTL